MAVSRIDKPGLKQLIVDLLLGLEWRRRPVLEGLDDGLGLVIKFDLDPLGWWLVSKLVVRLFSWPILKLVEAFLVRIFCSYIAVDEIIVLL